MPPDLPVLPVPPPEVAAAVARAHRDEWARVLASTARVTRDLDLAEECTQDAYAKAMDKAGLLSQFKKNNIDTSWAPAEPAVPAAAATS